MHIQYAPLIADEEIVTKRSSLTRKSSKKNVDGKSFQKVNYITFSQLLLFIFSLLATRSIRFYNLTKRKSSKLLQRTSRRYK
jgi:hypothetical protein